MENTQETQVTDVTENKGFDSVEAILADEKMGKMLTSHIDSQVGKAVEAYKEKGFASAVEKAVAERLKQQETKTPEQIKMDEMNAKLAAFEQQIRDKELNEMRLTNKSNASKKLTEAGLPLDLVDFIVSEDAEKTTANVDKVVNVLNKFMTETKQNVLKGNNVKSPGKTLITGDLQEPGENASKAEWAAYWKQLKNKR